MANAATPPSSPEDQMRELINVIVKCGADYEKVSALEKLRILVQEEGNLKWLRDDPTLRAALVAFQQTTIENLTRHTREATLFFRERQVREPMCEAAVLDARIELERMHEPADPIGNTSSALATASISNDLDMQDVKTIMRLLDQLIGNVWPVSDDDDYEAPMGGIGCP